MTALHWAALRGYDDIVRLLLEYEADVEVKDLVNAC
jgi:ankyrin repeat protein